MKTIAIIPARWHSTRLPGKPLTPINGKPLILHTLHQCQKTTQINDIHIATDHPKIYNTLKPHTQVHYTRTDHPTGTDRCAELAQKLNCHNIINIQADQPLIHPTTIDNIALALTHHPITTAATPITDPTQLHNPNTVKTITTTTGRALYFSRQPIPHQHQHHNQPPQTQLTHHTYLQHIGIYGYQKPTLQKLAQLPQTPLEKTEQLEQLRALENNIPIQILIHHNTQHISIDTPQDLQKLQTHLNQQQPTQPTNPTTPTT